MNIIQAVRSLLLVVLLGCTGTFLAKNPLKDLFIGRPWEFVENELIIKPEKEADCLINACKRWIPCVLAGAAAAYTTDVVASAAVPYQIGTLKANTLARCIADPLVGSVAAWGIYRFITGNLEQHSRYKAFKNFIVQWPENQIYAPQSLSSSFQQLHDIYLYQGESGEFEHVALEVMHLVKHTIYEHFPLKYESRVRPNPHYFTATFLHTVINLDVVELLKLLGKVVSTFFVESEHKTHR